MEFLAYLHLFRIIVGLTLVSISCSRNLIHATSAMYRVREKRHEYPGEPTWVDKAYDPHFMEKKRFAILKSIGAWFRDHDMLHCLAG